VKKRVAGSERNAPHPLERDLAHVFEKTQHVWPDLRKKRLFLTGGTGFFGSWLLESFAWLNTLLNTEAEIVVLSRNPGAFSRKAPHLAANKAIKLVEGDIRDFKCRKDRSIMSSRRCSGIGAAQPGRTTRHVRHDRCRHAACA